MHATLPRWKCGIVTRWTLTSARGEVWHPANLGRSRALVQIQPRRLEPSEGPTIFCGGATVGSCARLLSEYRAGSIPASAAWQRGRHLQIARLDLSAAASLEGLSDVATEPASNAGERQALQVQLLSLPLGGRGVVATLLASNQPTAVRFCLPVLRGRSVAGSRPLKPTTTGSIPSLAAWF